MEHRVKVFEVKFLKWLDEVREKDERWLWELESLVVRFLRDKQIKYRKIETYNRMLFGETISDNTNESDNDKQVTFNV